MDISSSESFSVSGQVILEKNYLEIYPYDNWLNKEVEVYEKGEVFSPASVTIEKEHTSPPSLLTDADLITLMDKHGIGTDSTHAEHIEKVKTREYVNNTGENTGYLTPGKLGLGLVQGYDEIGIYLFHPDLRSKFEADLKLICEGIKQPQDVLELHLKEYKTLFLETVSQIDKFVRGVAKHVGGMVPVQHSQDRILLEPIVNVRDVVETIGEFRDSLEKSFEDPIRVSEIISPEIQNDLSLDSTSRTAICHCGEPAALCKNDDGESF